ncbi:MAG: phosphoglucomutase (alpha-D-glucose-1,6-bisphosphate-dependent) [Actinomycetota bacterium]|nr:phosphoglucomutase (alpha-D-glucose-1,6-bisphosphate-dependent) [Actinomycetota bacterium]
MSEHERAGTRAQASDLVDVDRLVAAYYDERPDHTAPEQRVAFGTSGHRGSSLRRAFNEAHILATSQAICEYRSGQGADGPLYLGRDTHALSEPAFRSAVEVLAANGVDIMVDASDGPTPTPAVSHAILTHNRGRRDGLADGVVVTPSHNPPGDGGFKYNPPSGGPAGSDATGWIQDRANALLAEDLRGVERIPWEHAWASQSVHRHDYLGAYVDDLPAVVDLDAVRAAGPRLGVDPLGGASVAYWQAVAERHKLDIDVVNDAIDPTFAFMALDRDGGIRMDCSSAYAMRPLIDLADRFDLAFGNDPDADRHGIVTPGAGLLNPNHYLAVAVSYLLGARDDWPGGAGIGKTLVSSRMLDRVVEAAGRRLVEMPVGFKWFVDGLLDGSIAFGGEESAGASFLRRHGEAWTTDKDGLILCLLAAEVLARTGEDPGQRYRALTERFGDPVYQRIDAPATPEQKAALGCLSPDDVEASELAGEPITATLSRAPGNDEPIGGLKVVAEHGWFAARPSGTEDVYKLYAESFLGEDHLRRVLDDAQRLLDGVLAGT